MTTTYGYNTAGDLYTVTYSDSTPGLTYTYDRRGRPATVTDGTGATTTLAFNDPSQLVTESYSGTHPLAGLTVTNTYDQYLRRTNLAVQQSSNPLIQQSFAYDTASRLLRLTNGSAYAGYTYLANSPLVGQIGFTNGSTWMTTTKQYDYLNRLTQISSVPSASSVLSSSYGYNSANQRTALTCADNSYWVYGYDALGQVTSGKKYWSDGTPVAGQQFQYQFDDIGNRQTTDAGGDALGANLRHAVYTPDAGGLNQYVSRDVPGYVQTLGTAGASANVSLWSANSAYALASRKGTYFRAELPVNNANGAVWAQLTNLALVPGGSSADVLSSAAGNLFVPKTPEQFTYDQDGNLLTDGRWTYTWDAENRLVDMTSLSSAPSASKLKLDFTYDYKGRRTQKQVSTWNGSQYVVQGQSTRLFVYDGWNPLAVLNSSSSLLQSFVWGLDLSGTGQGAGGVGGLLEVNDTANGIHFAAYDGNGNVAGLVKATDGTTSAVYEYGPFGELIRATGPMAKANPFRFSTKFQDDETDLLYYGYRYLNTSTGRWVSRDPIAEKAFRATTLRISFSERDVAKLSKGPFGPAYGFAHNDPVAGRDVLGLRAFSRVTRFIWSAPACGKGLKTAYIQVAHAGTVLGLHFPFVDDGTVGLYSDKPVCPPLYPGSMPPTDGSNLFDDAPTSMGFGAYPLWGLTFEVCRVCLQPTCCPVSIGPQNNPTVLHYPGYSIVSVGPCKTYKIPGTQDSEDLDNTTDPNVGGSDTPSDVFTTTVRSSYPGVLSGGCFQCANPQAKQQPPLTFAPWPNAPFQQ